MAGGDKGGVKPGTGATEPLELTTNERDQIKLATDNFERVIVLVNTTSTMEIEELKTNDKIQAILWVGHPGCYGTLGIADVLSGKVAPSGGLSDIYAVKNLSHPALMNVGDFTYSNHDKITRKKPANGISSSAKYVMEPEGIYIGYRYYETRYNDIVYKTGKADSAVGKVASTGNWRYDEEVSYGFGYGDSYTTFTEELVGNPKITYNNRDHIYEMEFKIKVKNTGSVAGKDNVQLYGQAPYISGGVEKSAIQLLTYDKTEVLAPKAEQILTLTVDMQNLASYDDNHNKGDGTKGTYILDSGKYYFTVGEGAHDALNNVLTKQGKTVADGMDYAGNASKVFEHNYDFKNGKVDDEIFGTSKAGVKIANHLQETEWNYYSPEKKMLEFSRSNWSDTYPTTYNDIVAPAAIIPLLNGQYYKIKTNEDTSDIKFNDPNVKLTFADMKFSEFDDPRWDELLNKITILDCMNSLASGGPAFRALSSIGFTGGNMTENSGNGMALGVNDTRTPDAPWNIKKDDPNGRYQCEVFASGPNVASAFNPALQHELGQNVGIQALFVGIPIVWGPGLNTHRSPYNGRNGDYYSEDPVLCGVTALEFSMGSLEYGLIAAPKHYAFNDQEKNRGNLAPYMTEQRSREIELRAFQIAFEATKYDKIMGKDVGMLGIMTSFSKIGPIECNASIGLMTDITRKEFGFKGYAVTDISDDFDIFTALIVSGASTYDVRSGHTDIGFDQYQSMADGVKVTPELYKKDRLLLTNLKNAAKYNLYTLAQSNMMNNYNTTSRLVWKMTWWRGIYIGGICLFSLATLGAEHCMFCQVKNLKRKVRKL